MNTHDQEVFLYSGIVDTQKIFTKKKCYSVHIIGNNNDLLNT